MLSAELHITRGVTIKEFSPLTVTTKTRKELAGYWHCVKREMPTFSLGITSAVLLGFTVCAQGCVCQIASVWSDSHECKAHAIHPQWEGEKKLMDEQMNRPSNQWMHEKLDDVQDCSFSYTTFLKAAEITLLVKHQRTKWEIYNLLEKQVK